jgi:hypothetical protein
MTEDPAYAIAEDPAYAIAEDDLRDAQLALRAAFLALKPLPASPLVEAARFEIDRAQTEIGYAQWQVTLALSQARNRAGPA